MIIMDIKADNLYAFKNFHINMSYPKKIVNSELEGEYLPTRTNFRYKKVNIIMGANATGKTSLGKLLMLFANYFNDGISSRFTAVIDDTEKKAELKVDFITEEKYLNRFELLIYPQKQQDYDIQVHIQRVVINKSDNYEKCAKKFDLRQGKSVLYSDINTRGWMFCYPQDVSKNKKYLSIEDDKNYLTILEQIMKTLDPAIKRVVRIEDTENAYVIRYEHQSVVVQDGRIAKPELLSSGTKAGLDISYIIASLFCDMHDLYYCDELFSYVSSDVEKACLSIIIEKLNDKKQLFFTTHNSDIADMQLPKHAFTFMKKDIEDEDKPIKIIHVEDILKRNTDSIKQAVENDLFSNAPDVDRLYDLLKLEGNRLQA